MRAPWRVFFCCLFLTFFGELKAQTTDWRPVYTSRWTKLLASPGDQAAVLGVLCTEASITVLDSTKTTYKIRVSNGDIGYIERQPLTKAMYGKRSAGEPEQYFYRGPEGQQGPHLYVQAAELRVRNKPSVEGGIVRRARLNEHTSLDYYPLYTDAWVYIGDHFHERPEYIQVKFLGQELTYQQLLAAYQQVKGKDREGEWNAALRLREIAWTSGTLAETIQALAYFKESAVRMEQQHPKIDIDFEQFLAAKLRNLDYEKYEKALAKLDMHFEVQGQALWDGKITDKQATMLHLTKVDDIPDSPECGWEPTYFYQSPQLILAFEELYNAKGKIRGSIYSLFFTEDQALILGAEKIDANYTEKEFVNKFGHLLTVDWIGTPHYYRIANGDAGFFEIVFKNGKPFSFAAVYYC